MFILLHTYNRRATETFANATPIITSASANRLEVECFDWPPGDGTPNTCIRMYVYEYVTNRYTAVYNTQPV